MKKESKSEGSSGRGKYVAIYRSSPSLVAHAIRSFTQDIRTRRGKKMDPMEEWDGTGRNGIATRFSDVSYPSYICTLQRDVCSRSWAPHFGLTGVHTRTQLTRRTFQQQMGKIKKKEMNEFPTWFFRGIFPAFSIVDGCQELNEKEDERAGRASNLDNPIAFFFLLSLFQMLLLSATTCFIDSSTLNVDVNVLFQPSERLK